MLDKLNKKTYHCKKKGCEEQFSFNDKIDDWVQAAKKQLSKVTAGNDSSQRVLEQPKKELEKGEEDIHYQQKLIRIADRSDWGVVAEYLTDKLADDSDDEKRLFRGEMLNADVRHRQDWRMLQGGRCKKATMRTTQDKTSWALLHLFTVGASG